MSRSVFLCFLFALVLGFGACSEDESSPVQPAPPPDIIVYGREACGFCAATLAQLDEQKFRYEFKDVDIKANDTEMWLKVWTTLWYVFGEPVALPIVDVKGVIVERPTIEEIIDLMEGEPPSR